MWFLIKIPLACVSVSSQLPQVFLFNLLSIISLLFTPYLPLLTLKPFLPSSFTLLFHHPFLSFAPCPTFTLVRLLSHLSLSFFPPHLVLFAIFPHLSRLASESHSSPPSFLLLLPPLFSLRLPSWKRGEAWRWEQR